MRPYVNYFAGYYIFSYAAIGALFPLIAQYLHGIGFSGSPVSADRSILTRYRILRRADWCHHCFIYCNRHFVQFFLGRHLSQEAEKQKTDLVALCYNCPVIADVDVGGKFLDILTIIYTCFLF